MEQPSSPEGDAEVLNVWDALLEEHRHLGGEEPAGNTQSDIMSALHQAERSALCLSGGGVRSAMFSLGVLQEMARFSWKEPEPDAIEEPPKLLAAFDYLSTVSGGGYIGGWFSSWAARVSTTKVIKDLVTQPAEKLKPEPLPVEQVRAYASFLNPRVGLVSADSWTLGTTILRNIFLNWLVLLPLLAAVLAIPRILDAVMAIPSVREPVSLTLLVIAFITGACACFYMTSDLPSAGDARWTQKTFLIFSLGALACSGLCSILYWRWNPQSSWQSVTVYSMLMVLCGTLAGIAYSVPRVLKNRQRRVNASWIVTGVALLVVCAGVGGSIAHWVATLFAFPAAADEWSRLLYTWLAYPGLFFIYGVFQLLLVGGGSKLTDDQDREWWARCAAWFTMLMAAWFIGVGLTIFAGTLAGQVHLELLKLSGATTIAGAVMSLLGFSPKTSSGRKDEPAAKIGLPAIPARMREFSLKLILPVFLVLLVLTISIANGRVAESFMTHMSRVEAEFCNAAILALFGSCAAYLVNANKFSLNGMYRLRLIRTFLGASNKVRDASPLTNFDENDNLKMSRLRTVKPFHVVNMALNLVKTTNLAWQQRKAESFTATPLRCGSMNVGYVDTERYSTGPNDPVEGCSGLSLGSAMTISGAAASPNMGYHSSPLVTIVMTLFNARLGAWLANPGENGKGFWSKTTPEFAVSPMVSEAFGLTTDRNRWVYLSDGGHFENLGLYEMVLRRCRRVVIIDAGADPDYSFEDLANAIRKIRVDLGIEIEFTSGIDILKKGQQPSGKHCAYGEIRYSCVDQGAPAGEIAYIKTSLNSNEPRDVLHYSSENEAFPQQPTYDLWFDEAQLESYRRLGSHIIQEICGDNGSNRKLYSVAEFVEQCRQHAIA